MLTTKITPAHPGDSDPTSIFEESLFTIFADPRNQHGGPGESVTYRSERHGDLTLHLCDPSKEDTSLFSHFLWNAGVQAAEMMASGEFRVHGESFLEFGAGAGLPGLIAAKEGAKEVVMSDYPTPSVLDNIRRNVDANINAGERKESSIAVMGHKWGCMDDELCKSGKLFTRIVVADCMWMDRQHENLCQSIARFLKPESGMCLAIAGFHTGRAKLASFFQAAENAGLILWKPAVERDVCGEERPWVTDRGYEDPVERKR